MLKVADGPNVADAISLSFKLTGKGEAQVMPLVDQPGDVPAPEKAVGIFNESAIQNDMAGVKPSTILGAANVAPFYRCLLLLHPKEVVVS